MRIRKAICSQIIALFLFAKTIGDAKITIEHGQWMIFLDELKKRSVCNRYDKRDYCEYSGPYANPEADIASFNYQKLVSIASLPQE